jgi:RNA polymerase sigma-B factor
MMAPSTVPAHAPATSRAREDAQLFERFCRDRNPTDHEALVRRFLPLARHLAARYPHGGEREDVMQVASVGLLKAIDRYDPARGIAFSSFAVPTIVGEIKRYFRDLGWTVRVPRDVQELTLRMERVSESLVHELGRAPTVEEIAERCQASVEQVLEARASATAHHAISLDQPAHDEDEDGVVNRLAAEEPGFARVDDATEVDELLSVLEPRERRVLLLRFRDDLMQREIADQLGISQMQVSRLIAKSLATLQRLHEDGRARPSAAPSE